MRQDIREYITDLGETLARQKTAFRLVHPDFDTIDLAILADITIDGSPVFGSLAVIESTDGQMNVDVKNEQRQLEFCQRFLEGHQG